MTQRKARGGAPRLFGRFTWLAAPIALLSAWTLWRPSLDHPGSPVHLRGFIRLINAVGRVYASHFGRPLFGIDLAELEAEFAALKADERLYGDADAAAELTGLRAYLRGLNAADASVTPVGRVVLKRRTSGRLRHRRQIVDYARAHPEVLQTPIRRPLIIVGLPRTGSTLLQRLLASDPAARAAHTWELAVDPNPQPPGREEVLAQQDPRIRANQTRRLNLMNLISPDFYAEVNKYHEVKATNVDEESYLMRDCTWDSMSSVFLGQDSAYADWLLEPEGKRYVYRYIKVWLQVMSATYAPESHWVLKTPAHAFFLDVLLQEFPDATLVFTHRDPRAVVASACKLPVVAGALGIDFHRFDKAAHGRRVLAYLQTAAYRTRAFYLGGSPAAQRAVHVVYEDLVADPIGTITQLYAHAGYEMTERFQQNMADYLNQNPQHKHGKPAYSLAEFGLSEAQVQQAFADYTSTFRRREAQ